MTLEEFAGLVDMTIVVERSPREVWQARLKHRGDFVLTLRDNVLGDGDIGSGSTVVDALMALCSGIGGQRLVAGTGERRRSWNAPTGLTIRGSAAVEIPAPLYRPRDCP